MRFLTRLHIALVDKRRIRNQKKLTKHMKACGRNVFIDPTCDLQPLGNISLGDNVYLQDHCLFRAEGGITIGSGSLIGRYTEMRTGGHVFDAEDQEMIPYDHRIVTKPLVIGENVWVANRVTFVKGVTVGEGAVIGMGAVVTKDVPPLAIVGGNPAKIIKYRNAETYYKLKAEGKIYLDMTYDYDKSSLKKSEWTFEGK